MAIYVYATATGALYSTIPDNVTVATAQASGQLATTAVLTAKGLTAIDSLPALGPTVAWSVTTKTTQAIAPPAQPNKIPTYEFILLFTPAEHAAIVASTDQRVTQFMMALQVAQVIDLNSTTIQNGLAYLVALNLLTQANATIILSGQPSQ